MEVIDLSTRALLKCVEIIFEIIIVQYRWEFRLTLSRSDCCTTISFWNVLKIKFTMILLENPCTMAASPPNDLTLTYLFTFSQNDYCTINLLKYLENIIEICSVQNPWRMAASPPNERRSFNFLSKWLLYNKPFEISWKYNWDLFCTKSLHHGG